MEKVNKKKLAFNLTKVILSQGISVLSGIVVGFIIPIALGVTEYGYYKLYALYFSYTSLLHFGFIDGFLLKYAGNRYEDLDKQKIRTLSKFYIAFQFFVGLIFIVVGSIFSFELSGFICVMIGINLFITNITSYFQFLSQATQRFTEFSLRNIIVSCLKIIISVVIYLMFVKTSNHVSYKIYLISVSIVELFMALYYVKTYRDIVFGERNSISSEKETIKSLFKTGIIITFAYQVGHLVFTLDRQFVSFLFDIEIYSVYSFAYNIITIFTTMIATLSTVLFPMLKSISKDEAISYYSKIAKVVSFISAAALIGYYPIRIIIVKYLSEYAGSISFLNIVFPSLILLTAISVVGFTFYKLLDENFRYFVIGVIVLLIGLILNFIAYKIFKNPQGISWASIITLCIWYIVLNIFLRNKYKTKFIDNLSYIICILCSFYFCIWNLGEGVLSFIIYFLLFLSLSFIFNRKSILNFMKRKQNIKI